MGKSIYSLGRKVPAHRRKRPFLEKRRFFKKILPVFSDRLDEELASLLEDRTTVYDFGFVKGPSKEYEDDYYNDQMLARRNFELFPITRRIEQFQAISVISSSQTQRAVALFGNVQKPDLAGALEYTVFLLTQKPEANFGKVPRDSLVSRLQQEVDAILEQKPYAVPTAFRQLVLQDTPPKISGKRQNMTIEDTVLATLYHWSSIKREGRSEISLHQQFFVVCQALTGLQDVLDEYVTNNTFADKKNAFLIGKGVRPDVTQQIVEVDIMHPEYTCPATYVHPGSAVLARRLHDVLPAAAHWNDLFKRNVITLSEYRAGLRYFAKGESEGFDLARCAVRDCQQTTEYNPHPLLREQYTITKTLREIIATGELPILEQGAVLAEKQREGTNQIHIYNDSVCWDFEKFERGMPSIAAYLVGLAEVRNTIKKQDGVKSKLLDYLIEAGVEESLVMELAEEIDRASPKELPELVQLQGNSGAMFSTYSNTLNREVFIHTDDILQARVTRDVALLVSEDPVTHLLSEQVIRYYENPDTKRAAVVRQAIRHNSDSTTRETLQKVNELYSAITSELANRNPGCEVTSEVKRAIHYGIFAGRLHQYTELLKARPLFQEGKGRIMWERSQFEGAEKEGIQDRVNTEKRISKEELAEHRWLYTLLQELNTERIKSEPYILADDDNTPDEFEVIPNSHLPGKVDYGFFRITRPTTPLAALTAEDIVSTVLAFGVAIHYESLTRDRSKRDSKLIELPSDQRQQYLALMNPQAQIAKTLIAGYVSSIPRMASAVKMGKPKKANFYLAAAKQYKKRIEDIYGLRPGVQENIFQMRVHDLTSLLKRPTIVSRNLLDGQPVLDGNLDKYKL